MKITLLKLTLSMLLFTSCATRLSTPQGIPDIPISEYEELVETNTKKTEVYDGLHNKLTVQATILDTKLTEAFLSHSARLSQWSEQKYKEEKGKRIGKNAENTEFFVSFFTPERKHQDLSSAKNVWKIFLDVNGQRYEGKATKIKQLLSEVQAMYPHHNRWSVPYTISFPVATSLSENKNAKLILTGAIGSAEVGF